MAKRSLPTSAIPTARKKLAAKQKYRCPICEGNLATGVTCLDHCHETGNIRATLCASCNTSEGKVKAGMLFRTSRSNLASTNPVKWLRNLADYLEYHNKNPSCLIHPTFCVRSGRQKPVKRKK